MPTTVLSTMHPSGAFRPGTVAGQGVPRQFGHESPCPGGVDAEPSPEWEPKAWRNRLGARAPRPQGPRQAADMRASSTPPATTLATWPAALAPIACISG